MRDRILGKSLGSLVLHPWIHRCLVAGALAGALCVAPGAALADQSEQYVRWLGEDFDVWKNNVDGHLEVTNHDERQLRTCNDHLSQLDEWKAPDSLTFELKHDIPELKAGTHRWTEARAACAHLVQLADRQKLIHGVKWAIWVCKDGADAGLASNLPHFEKAKEYYDKAIKAGIPVKEIMYEGSEQGTLQELYDKWCLAAGSKLQAAEDARAAPFKKLLKNDKLRIALQDTDYIMLPGGAKATPQRLAATNVWFEDASPSKVCPNGAQVHVLHRYQFDGQQKLAKVTDREFCGRPPGSAFH